jgi:hypothetical protein
MYCIGVHIQLKKSQQNPEIYCSKWIVPRKGYLIYCQGKAISYLALTQVDISRTPEGHKTTESIFTWRMTLRKQLLPRFHKAPT